MTAARISCALRMQLSYASTLCGGRPPVRPGPGYDPVRQGRPGPRMHAPNALAKAWPWPRVRIHCWLRPVCLARTPIALATGTGRTRRLRWRRMYVYNCNEILTKTILRSTKTASLQNSKIYIRVLAEIGWFVLEIILATPHTCAGLIKWAILRPIVSFWPLVQDGPLGWPSVDSRYFALRSAC